MSTKKRKSSAGGGYMGMMGGMMGGGNDGRRHDGRRPTLVMMRIASERDQFPHSLQPSDFQETLTVPVGFFFVVRAPASDEKRRPNRT